MVVDDADVGEVLPQYDVPDNAQHDARRRHDVDRRVGRRRRVVVRPVDGRQVSDPHRVGQRAHRGGDEPRRQVDDQRHAASDSATHCAHTGAELDGTDFFKVVA